MAGLLCGIRNPLFEELMNPLLKALKDLGGSGSIDEIYERVTENLSI
jgi:restriction system protein